MVKKIALMMLLALPAAPALAQRLDKPSFAPRKASSIVRRAATTTTQPTSIVSTWTYSPNLPACVPNSTLTTCYSGFTLQITEPDGTVVTIGPATLGPTALSNTWTPTGGLPYGTFNISLWVNGYDDLGNPIVSTSISGTIANHVTFLNPPTGLTNTLQ